MDDKINEILEKNGYAYQGYNYWNKKLYVNNMYWGRVQISYHKKKFILHIGDFFVKSECDIEFVKELFEEANQLVKQINEMVGEERWKIKI
jgi:hypothetical protein